MHLNISRDRLKVLLLGLGLALYGVHWQSQPLIQYIFLPQIGFVLFFGCTYLLLNDQYNKTKRIDFGPKIIWIPLLVIVASTGFGVIMEPSMLSLSKLFFGCILFSVYLVARQVGKDIFYGFIPILALVMFSIVFDGVSHPGVITGGIITNYCASAGFVVFGVVAIQSKKQWLLVSLAVVALFFTGALEAALILAVMFCIILVRRDFSRKLLLPIAVAIVLIGAWYVTGNLVPLYTGNGNVGALYDVVAGNAPLSSGAMDDITTDRWYVIQRAIQNISWLGHGYTPGSVTSGIVHNIPLVIVDQVGPLAAIAWVWVTVYCLVKTKWTYAWIAVISMGLVDHYLWSQFAPFWWTLTGVSLTSNIKSDLVFKQ